MIERVLDTSVAAAWYLPETFSHEARRWREDMVSQRVRFLVPPLHYLEMANVLRAIVRRGELDAVIALDVYDTHLGAPLDVRDPPREKLLEIALEYETTAYDAAFVCLALEHRAPVLTAERSTTPWVVKLGDLAEPLGGA